ncbi:MAG: PKD domain-containing protein [Patescibacteria group bacterium]|nr:PKD domain-containing protein [Patescibacteria group bacterium]
MSFFTKKRIFILGFVFILLATIPLTVYLVEKQQETRSRATKATDLSFAEPVSGKTSSQTSPFNKTVNDVFDLDVVVNPGTNQVAFVKLDITYDSTKVATSAGTCSQAICANESVMSLINVEYKPGNILATLSIEGNQTKIIQTKSKIATLTLKAIASTNGGQIPIEFGNSTSVSSTSDSPLENVLSSTNPAFIAISENGLTGTPSPTPQGGGSVNQVPICNALGIDREATGSAPLSITFTATGRDPDLDGTINKVTFNFGDGPVENVTEAGGIGTNSVSLEKAHTFKNPGTFQVSAILTDDKGGISEIANCTQTITVTGAIAETSSGGATLTPTSAPIAEAESSSPTIAQAGPSGKVLGIGTAGIVLTIIGGFLLFAL